MKKLFIENLLTIEQLNPSERLEFFINNGCQKPLVFNQILLALSVIDEVIRNKMKSSFLFYVQDDFSIYFFIHESLSVNYTKTDFEQALFFLDFSKLIYRFRCAKKFKINNGSVNQLRINSWGKDYLLDKNILAMHCDDYHKLKNYFNNYFNERENHYFMLLELLLTDEFSEKINFLNTSLDIKILS